MKCQKCGSEWHCAGNVKFCPFCSQDCSLPAAEIESMFAAAEDMPATDKATRAEKAKAYLAVAEYG